MLTFLGFLIGCVYGVYLAHKDYPILPFVIWQLVWVAYGIAVGKGY